MASHYDTRFINCSGVVILRPFASLPLGSVGGCFYIVSHYRF